MKKNMKEIMTLKFLIERFGAEGPSVNDINDWSETWDEDVAEYNQEVDKHNQHIDIAIGILNRMLKKEGKQMSEEWIKTIKFKHYEGEKKYN